MDYETDPKTGKIETTPVHIARIRPLAEENNKAGKNGEAQTIEVKIIKNRNGFKSTQKLYFYPKYNTFTELILDKEAGFSEDPGDEAEPQPRYKRTRGHNY